MQNRPFESVEDMNRILLTNYNAFVGKDDTVYILGDICHHMSVDEANSVIARMKGKKDCALKHYVTITIQSS